MRAQSNNRLTVIGSEAQVLRFKRSAWESSLHARHCELLEDSPRRYVCQFESKSLSLKSLGRLSGRQPGLILLLEYEMESTRTKGLAKAVAGKLDHCEFNY